MRSTRILIAFCLIAGVSSAAEAQRCSTGSSHTSATAPPDEMAAANVDILFEGTKLTREQRKKAIAIYSSAFTALLKLDYRTADYQTKFDGILAKRNDDLWSLAPTDSAKAKLETCFRKMNQPAPTKKTPGSLL
jgi:hypothetical protein